MAQYQVFQFQLGNDDIDLANSEGWESSPKLKAYMSTRLGKWTHDAHIHYDLVANIESPTLEKVFDIGNIGPETAITRLKPMSSVSVGDVILDPSGDLHMVAPIGFVKI